MPAPYSIDLRQRVINAYEAKEGPQRQIARLNTMVYSFENRCKVAHSILQAFFYSSAQN